MRLTPRLALSILFTAAVGAQALNSTWVSWLRQHASPISVNGPSSRDDYADLQPLKQAIGDRRIVQIGESHHSVAEYHQLKTRLVKFLHAEMGFDVLAFESSIYECFAADLDNLTPSAALAATLFPVWATQEMVPLFEYLQASRSTERPLNFAGFDTQISSYAAVGSRPAFFRSVLSPIDAAYAEEVEQFDAEFIDRIRREGPAYARVEEPRLVAFYERLAAFITSHRPQIDEVSADRRVGFFAERTAWSMVRFIRQMRSFAADQNDPSEDGHFVIRDRAMADNVSAIARELYPDKKIIVWAANLHVRHANHETTYTFRTMGSWLVERFRDELYTIGLYPNRGQYVNGNRAVRPIDPAPPGSMQHLLASVGTSPLFVDLLNHEQQTGNAWMFDQIVAPEPQPIGNDIERLPIAPRSQYDGLLFVDLVSAPRFLGH